MTLSDILRDLRENPVTPSRTSHEERPLKRGGRAWRRREKRKQELIDKELERLHGRKKAQARYYYKNKERLNAQRAAKGRMPHYVYKKAKRRALDKDQAWEFSFKEWWKMWEDAPDVYDPDKGWDVSAWKMKGSDYNTSTQMSRIDTDGPWSKENCHITLQGEALSED